MNASAEVVSRSFRSGWSAIVAAVAVTLLALGVIAKVSALDRSPGWSGPVVAIVFGVAVVILLGLTRGTNRPAEWVAVLGEQ